MSSVLKTSMENINKEFNNYKNYKKNYDAFMSIPIVKQLLKKIKKLEIRNKQLVDLLIANVEIKKEKVVKGVEILKEDEEQNIVYELLSEDNEEEEEQEKQEVEEEEQEEEEQEEQEVEEEQEQEEQEEEEEKEEVEEEEEQEEEEEVFEVNIDGKIYYSDNRDHGTIYDVDENGDISIEVGKFKKGKAIFN